MPITKSELKNNSENLTLTSNDFDVELGNTEYAQSYKEMEDKLKNGDLTLPAPIIIKFDDIYYGFAGNRRMNLAWNHNTPLKVWIVKVEKRNSIV